MIKCFSCGQYTCRINGRKELISLIPDNWVKYAQTQTNSSDIVTIVLKEEKLECGTVIDSGWLVLARQGFPMMTYCRNRKLLFGLQYVDSHDVTVCVRKALDSYIRIGIHYGLMLALHQECVGLHGVTLLCGNEIIILSASSGTGKTTLGKLLETYCDAVIINGDFALLTPTEDGVIFEPTPFCGTSGRALNHQFRINRVVFLSQSETNEWHKLNGREAMTQFMNNSFVPDWDHEMCQAVQENISKCIDALEVNAYAFAPTQEAAEMFFKQVTRKEQQAEKIF